MGALKILIADDHDVIRRGLRQLIETRPGWAICGEAQTGREAVEKAARHKPDVAILDISMPELSGLEAAKQIRQTSPKTESLVLSLHYADHVVRACVDAGIRGYMVKSDCAKDLLTAVEAVANHKQFLTPCATDAIINENTSGFITGGSRDRLTFREKEVVQMIADGKSSREIGFGLSISIKTVETHRANIMRKLGIHSATELVRYALRNEIVQA